MYKRTEEADLLRTLLGGTPGNLDAVCLAPPPPKKRTQMPSPPVSRLALG